MKRVTIAILSFLVIAGLMVFIQPPITSASTTLVVGDTATDITPADNTFPGSGFNIVATDTESFSGGDFSGTVTSLVIRETSGKIDLFYKIVYTGAAVDGITRVSLTDFTQYSNGFPTGLVAGYTNDLLYTGDTAGNTNPVTADYKFASVVGFNFTTLSSGNTTDWFYVVTDATDWKTGDMLLQDGAQVHVSTFVPVPLPASALLLGTGFLGLVGLGWRRRKTKV